jgi:hypothetical protein
MKLTHRPTAGPLSSIRRLLVPLALLALALLAPASAFASFSRSFAGALPTGTQATGEPGGGIAVAPSTSLLYGGHVWTGAASTIGGKLDEFDEFSASNVFIGHEAPVSPLNGSSSERLAFDALTEQLYSGEKAGIAVDNSAGPDAGDVYFGAGGSAFALGSVSRERPVPPGYASFEAAGFTCPAGISAGYIKEGRLIGNPNGEGGVEEWLEGEGVDGVAVDSGSVARSVSPGSVGYVYVINNTGHPAPRIDVFTAEGCFVGTITGREQVEKEGRKEEVNLFYNGVSGVAVDPTDGDVVVTVRGGADDNGAVLYEFAALGPSGEFSGELLGAITGSSEKARFEHEAFGDGAIAVGSGGELYVNVRETLYDAAHEEVGAYHVVDVFSPGGYFPGAVTGEVSGASAAGVVLHGVVRGVENHTEEDLELSECKFEVIGEEVFKQNVGEGKGGFAGSTSVACSPGLAHEHLAEKNVAVSAVAGGLVSGVVYDYRLVAATNIGEHGGVKEGEVASFAAPGEPLVGASSVGSVSSSFAVLSGEVDPRGSATSYQFVYADEEGVGGTVPAVAAGIGSGDSYVGVAARVSGLSPGRAYSFRVVASNGVGVVSGGEATFRTMAAGSPLLPDGRAYELVTPANKEDAEDLFNGLSSVRGEFSYDHGLASEDGEHFMLLTTAAFGSLPSAAQDSYVFSRGQTGWSYRSAAEPGLGVQSLAAEAYDPFDFSVLGLADNLGPQINGKVETIKVGSVGGPYATLAAAASFEQEKYSILPVGGSADLSHVVVDSTDHALVLCEGSEEQLEQKLDKGVYALYAWSAGGPCLSLLAVKSGGAGLVSKCGAVLGQGTEGELGFAGSTRGAVSEDGSRAFFTAPDPSREGPGCWRQSGGGLSEENAPEVYARQEITGPSGEASDETIELSAPDEQGVVPPKRYPAIYVGAAADGSRVFFLTRSELTREALALKTHEPELYEYDFDAPEGERLVRASRGDLPSGPVEGRVIDVPAISADGSTVYFDAEAELTPGASHGGIYRYDTHTGSTAYVGQSPGYPGAASNGFTGSWYDTSGVEETIGKVDAGLDLQAPYFTTRDGRFLLFGAYRYDAGDGSVVCVMCNPDGSGPIADASFTRTAYSLDNPAGRPPRGISENGEYVFFDTAEALVPQDINGKVDVYEWEADGAGSCTEAKGCIGLISSGEDPENSYFFDSSAYVNANGETVEGGNVFFGTQAKLVPQDTDDEGDLYDARIGGGFPPAKSVGPCEGDACDNPPPAPLEQTPSSLTFSGAGDVPASGPASGQASKTKTKTLKCRKKLVRKKVKKKEVCVRAGKSARAKKTNRGRRG